MVSENCGVKVYPNEKGTLAHWSLLHPRQTGPVSQLYLLRVSLAPVILTAPDSGCSQAVDTTIVV